MCTKGDPLYVGTYEDQQRIAGDGDPFRTFQQTVETCALVICVSPSNTSAVRWMAWASRESFKWG